MEPRDIHKLRIVGPRSVSRRGGSLQVTIPPEIGSRLGIEEGTKIVFIIDEHNGYVMLGRSDRMEITLSKLGKPATLGFRVPKEFVKKIARQRA